MDHGSSSLPCNELAKEIYWWALKYEVTLESVWVPRAENELADHLSKFKDSDGW